MELQQTENRKVTIDPKMVRGHAWLFHAKKNGIEVSICRAFLIQVHQVSVKRIRVLQFKILQNLSFSEKRGKHGKQRKLEEDVWQLTMDYLQSIPHYQSHYTTHTNKQYFDNSNLISKMIFSMFEKYYENKIRQTSKNGI